MNPVDVDTSPAALSTSSSDGSLLRRFQRGNEEAAT
jgi:hypothetical protein